MQLIFFIDKFYIFNNVNIFDNNALSMEKSISRELNLSSITFPKMSKDIIMSQELNDYLRDQLNQTEQENDCLLKDLLSKDEQIKKHEKTIVELTNKLTQYETSCQNDFVTPAQTTNNKIIEISKKLRDKNAEVEVYKSKCSKLGNLVKELQVAETVNKEVGEKEKKVDDANQIHILQDKLLQIKNKWLEEKNFNVKLKNDLKRANKWLQQEIGDKYETLLTLNSSSKSSWRGRAQIICDLQQKNQELREKLKMVQEKKDIPQCDTNNQTLKAEHLKLNTNYTELKTKFDALKTKCNSLENECNMMRSKVKGLTEIHENDQQVIARLTSQISYYGQLKDEKIQHKLETIKQLQDENESLKIEIFKEKCLSENKSLQLLEKQDEFNKIKTLRPPSSYYLKPQNSETKLISKLEVERQRLLELTEVQNLRLQEERNASFKTTQLLRLEKQKCAKLEAKLARIELDKQNLIPSYCKKTTPSQCELDIKDRLELAEESIRALTTRLEIENFERKQDLKKLNKILNDE